MKKLVKFLVTASALVALAAFLCLSASAEDVYTPIADFDYTVEGDSITIECYNGNDTVINIAPEYEVGGTAYKVAAITGYTSRRVPYGAFEDCSHITKVIIPESVTAIGDDTYTTVFAGCSSLQDVVIYGNPVISKNSIGYVYDGDTDGYIFGNYGTTVNGWTGDATTVSYAEAYAKANGLTFKGLENVVLRGYQPSADMSGETFNIRFIATVDSLNYKNVGFTVSEKSSGKSWESTSKIAYLTLNATLSDGSVMEDAVRALDYANASHLTAVSIKNIPSNADLSFAVVPYVVNKLGVRVNGNAATLNFTDGSFEAPQSAAVHIVTFADFDGRVIKKDVVVSGSSAVAPADPERAGYLFKNWDMAFSAVTSDLTVTATYESTVTGPTIIVSSATAKAGDTVDVTVSMVNNPGISAALLVATFGSDLELTAIKYNDAMGGTSMPPEDKTSPANLTWADPTQDYVESEYIFATLTFRVSDSAAVEDELKIEISYNPENVFNLLEHNITFDVIDGVIKVK